MPRFHSQWLIPIVIFIEAIVRIPITSISRFILSLSLNQHTTYVSFSILKLKLPVNIFQEKKKITRRYLKLMLRQHVTPGTGIRMIYSISRL